MQGSILITGASRGIGFELVRQYSADGWRVYATCRNPENAQALTQLVVNCNGNVSLHPMDVTDAKQISVMAGLLQNKPLDILINCAGIYGQTDASFGRADPQKWLNAFQVNAIGPMKVMEAFVEHVAMSPTKIMANLTSKMGSMGDNRSGGSYVYRSSKAALNAVVKSAAIDLFPRNITVVALHPGWVKTDMTGPNALISAEESVIGLRSVLTNLTLDDTGKFLQYDGVSVPW